MKEKKDNFLTKTISLVTAPANAWEAIAKEEDERGFEFTRYFVPALLLSVAGRMFSQTVLGVYILTDVYYPEFSELLPFSLLQAFVVLLMPFVLAKPLYLVAKRFTDSVDVEATRRYIIFAYLPVLVLSTVEFIPGANLSYMLMNFYAIYICMSGAEVMLNILPQHRGIFVFSSALLVLIYYVLFAFLVHLIAPNPVVDHYLERVMPETAETI